MEKLKEAILLILKVMGSRASKVKLAKALFFSDFSAYKKYHTPITGDKYVHYPYGPLPSHFENAIGQLEKENALLILPRERKQGWRFEVQRKAKKIFTKEEVELIEEIASFLKDKTAVQVSELSHLFKGWQITKDREYINYELIDMLDWDNPDNPPQYEEIDPNEQKLFDSPEFKRYAELAIKHAIENNS